MKSNLPVTQREYAFPAERTLVSVTDLKGRITYCNPSFIEVSGFSRDELLGQAHSVVRHPDMPEEAFRDMWETIQRGSPWTGLVKNRRKNGDHYWVRANATPMTDGDKITGYLSVRTVPSRAEVEVAEGLYATMRQEASAGRLVHVLRQGRVLRRDFWGRLLGALRLGSGGQLVLIQLLASALVVLPLVFDLPHWTVGIGVIASVLWAVWTTRALTVAPLEALVVDANRLASGDLSTAVRTGAAGAVGRLQQALRQLSLNLRTVVQDVRAELLHLGQAVQEVAEGNDNLSSRTESQAINLERTAASLDQLQTSVQHNSASAHQGAAMAHETLDVTGRSNAAVQAVAQTMDGIADSSHRIENIIRLVEGVAFQTNILALNAAVEAARAGDAGRGFAVVATEVRALAGRTTDAAKEIRRLIAESSERVTRGAQSTVEATTRMDEVNLAVDKVKTVLDDISATANEQRVGIGRVSESMQELDAITQQNAALVEELAAAAKTLEGQVEGVNNSMRLFRLRSGDVTVAQTDAVMLRRQGRALVGQD